MSDPHRIATLTVMRGEVDRLSALLPSIEWADERHVVETGPDPSATRRAIVTGTLLHHHPLADGASFEDARREALPHIKAGWVLVVDTDEVIPVELARRLRDGVEEWSNTDITGVWLPRSNHVMGRPLRYCSAWPDYQLRFVKTADLAFSAVLHHAMDAVRGRTITLDLSPAQAIQHFNFTSTAEFLTKLNLYSSIELEGATTGLIGSPPRWALIKSSREFAARYLKMRGYRDGSMGLHYCLMLALYRYLIEVKGWELGIDKS